MIVNRGENNARNSSVTIIVTLRKSVKNFIRTFSEWSPKYSKLALSKERNDMKRFFFIAVTTESWENIERYSRNRGT